MSSASQPGPWQRLGIVCILLCFALRLAHPALSLQAQIADLPTGGAQFSVLAHQAHTPAAHPVMDDDPSVPTVRGLTAGLASDEGTPPTLYTALVTAPLRAPAPLRI